MIEAAIFLPILLVVFFITIGISVALNGRTSLSSAMTEALRLAATRGDLTEWGGEPLIPEVQYYREFGYSINTLDNLLISGDVQQQDAHTFLDRCFGAVYDLNKLSDFPPQFIHTLIYLNQALKQSIGPSLRFPCVPPGGSPPGEDLSCPGSSRVEGCVGCYLLNPESLNFTKVTDGTPPNPRRFAIRCEYSPSNIFFDPIFRILRLFGGGSSSGGGGIVITRDRIFEITRLGE